jgi:hypothetical protein
MLSWQRAKQWWDNHSTNETFEETLGWHLTNGLIYSTPQIFLLARETHWDGAEANDDAGPHNAWFVELAASADHANPVREFLRVASRPQQWALWCRHNSFEVRAYDWNKLARKVGL